MKNKLLSLALAFAVTMSVSLAFAGGNELAYFKIQELPALAGGSVTASDYIPVYDASVGKVKKVVATSFGGGGAYNGTIGATTPSTGAFTSLTDTLGITGTLTPTADHATTKFGFKVNYTVPVHTTGTNTDYGYLVSPTISNATGGTNTFAGFKFGNVTGDAQVNVSGLDIGTGTILGTSNAVNIGSGWDASISGTLAPAIDNGATVYGTTYAATVPAHTTGTNTLTVNNIALTVGNATGGTNQVNGWNFANYTGDAQVNVNAINIGTSDALGTANAIKIGTGWDAGLVTDSAVQINSTNGTAITAIRFAFDAVASGQTSKTTTLTGVTASSRCVATAAEVATNAVYLRAAVPGTDQVVVTVSADPGVSNMDYTVVCYN